MGTTSRADREWRVSTEAVRKPFCGPSGRKIDSNGTPHTHQRFAEAAPSILLLRANNHFERFHTAWTPTRTLPRPIKMARSGEHWSSRVRRADGKVAPITSAKD